MSSDVPSIPPEVLAAAIEKADEIQLNQVQFILTSKSYHNQDGLRIEEHLLVDGAFPPDFPKFVAHGVVTVTLPSNKMLAPGEKPPQHRQPIQVPIQADTIQEAFKAAPAVLQQAAEQFQAQFEENMKGKAAQDSIRRQLTKGLR
jgi:hypothetical protein